MQRSPKSNDPQSVLDDAVVRRLFEGLDASDLNWLLSDKINDCLHQFHLDTKSVSRVTTADIPWPVLFMLGRRHRKHRFLANSAPSYKHLHAALDDATSKVKWRHHFACKDDSKPRPHKTLLYKKRITKFEGSSVAEVNEFCKEMSQTFVESAALAISRCRGRVKKHGNVLPIDRAAHAWLFNADFAAVPCDKERGYCLVRLSDFTSNQLSILQSSWYEEVSLSSISLPAWKNSVVPTYTRIAKQICDVDDRVNMSMLCASLQFGQRRFPAHLMHTVKTHKPPGKVTFRPVHASSNHPFTGVMSWINLVTDIALAKHRHIIRSCDDLLVQLSDVHPVDDMIWVHLDINDFFMMGTVDFLVHHCSLVVPRKLRNAYRTALAFILRHQFVQCRLIPGRLWRVVTGTGMGLKCSSSVADAAFLHAVELMSIGLALKRTQERSGIIFYRRFRDNLLFAWHPNFVKIKQMMARLEKSDPYTGAVEEASPVGVDFLDANIFHDIATKCVMYTPVLKPSSLTSILGFHSAHPLSVHGAWLKAYLFRIRKRSSTIEWFQAFKREVFDRLGAHGVDPTVLAALDRETMFTYPVPRLQARSKVQRCPTLRIVLPYHPVWCKAFQNVCAALSKRLKLLDVPGLASLQRMSIAWELKSPALGNIVLKY